jgi:c-di-GMP phosphodiesterase
MLEKFKNALLGTRSCADVNNLKQLRMTWFYHFCSLLAITIFAMYGIVHFAFDKKIIMGTMDLVSAAALVANLIFFRISKKLQIASSIALFICMILFTMSVIDGGVVQMGIIWVLCFPILSLYMKGKKEGLLFILIFMLLYITLAVLDYFKVYDTPYSVATFAYVFSAFVVVSIMTYFYEDTNARSEEIIHNQVYTDQLTCLPNRLQLIEDIKNEKDLKLVMVNIDDFKGINDLYGSKMGDLVLLALTDIFLEIQKDEKKMFRIYKLHADEFAVLLKGVRNKKEISNFINTVNSKLMREITINNTEIVISITCGIADHRKDILTDADMALKLAKDQKKHFVYFNDSLKFSQKNKENIRSLKNIKRAVVSDGITPYFQPIQNNSSGKIEKYECLMRLIVGREVLTPNFFMQLAKRSKLYPHLTKTMMDKSFKTLRDSKYEFSVNVSIDDILNDDTVEFIMETLRYYNISHRVVFEIIESEKIEDDDKVSDFIRNAKKLGCRIAIDDFGAGYSNFDYILRMNVDFIKIDSSLIKNIDKDKSSQILAETIVSFSKKLNIGTIAEYVHSREVYNKVRELEIDYSQGYYIGRPMPSLIK